MASMGLDHPNDIKWNRRCASDDMVDAVVCDTDSPPKWHSSLALFSYTPDDEYQVYDGREIVYLKVAATLTGYQPERDEIEGQLDRDSFETEIEQDFEKMLNSYRKCSGGLLEVTVGPPDDEEWDADEYPYIMDYQPKRRAMYTMVTDTDKRMSRSIEQLQTRKAAGTTETNEVLDVDLGGSKSVSGGVSGGTGNAQIGIRGSYSQSNRQRVGSKRMNQQKEERVQTSSRSQEQREAYSHTTQLTQLHHLLDSYHKGTNRALFFFLPRPYVHEEPTGFVDGPRGIDGVQETFFVVSKPEGMGDVKTSVRLDTSHYGETKLYKYDTAREVVSGPEIDLNPPSENNPEAVNYGQKNVPTYVFPEKRNLKTGELIYEKYKLEESKTKEWRPENHNYSGYEIDTTKGNGGYEVVDDNVSADASYDVSVEGNGEYLHIKTEATSIAWHYDRAKSGAKLARNPEVWKERSGHVSVDVKVYLKSEEKTEPAGTEKNLLITTRGLCCGTEEEQSDVPENVPVETIPVDEQMETIRNRKKAPDLSIDDGEDDESSSSDDTEVDVTPSAAAGGSDSSTHRVQRASANSGGMTIHEANELGRKVVKEALGQSASRRGQWTPNSTLEADHTVRSMEAVVRGSAAGRRLLDRPAAEVDSVLTGALAKVPGMDLASISRRTVVDADVDELQRITGLDRGTINRGKLAALGVPLRDTASNEAREAARPADDESGLYLSLDLEADFDGDGENEVDVELDAGIEDDTEGDETGE